MKNLNTKTDDDLILEFLIQEGDEIKLSKPLQLKLERMDACRDLIRTYGSRVRIAPMLQKMFNISKAQAYRVIESTQKVFGSSQKTVREFWLDIILGSIIDEKKKALLKNDFRSVAMMQKNMITAIEKLAGTNESIPFEKVQPPPVVIGFFPDTLKVELPEDWEDQVKQIIKPRRKIDQMPTEAEVLEDGRDD